MLHKWIEWFVESLPASLFDTLIGFANYWVFLFTTTRFYCCQLDRTKGSQEWISGQDLINFFGHNLSRFEVEYSFYLHHNNCYQDQEHTSHGEKISEVAAKCWSLNSNQLVAIGVNCLHPSLVAPLLKSIHEELPRIPLIAYPNSGETYNAQLGQ